MAPWEMGLLSSFHPHPPPSSPFALRMHEIEQNDGTHPAINYSVYAPPRRAHPVCRKTHFGIKEFFFLRFDVRNWSVTFGRRGLFLKQV